MSECAGEILGRHCAPQGRLALLSMEVGGDFSCQIRVRQGAVLCVRTPHLLRIRARRTFERFGRHSLLLVPQGETLALTSLTPRARFALLSPSRALVEESADLHGFSSKEYSSALQRLAPIRKKVWLYEILCRYVFERTVAGNDANAAITFLETEIVKELTFTAREEANPALLYRFSPSEDQRTEENPVLSAALEHIERHLFEPLALADIATQCGISVATLVRTFQRALGTSAALYLRTRRLHEAYNLLQSSDRQVSDIAEHIGYASVSAFTFAFRRQFGIPPTALR